MRRKTAGATVVVVILGAAFVWHRAFLPDAPRVEDILAAYQGQGDYGTVHIEQPLDRTLFPQDVAAPTFHWKDGVETSRAWLVQVTCGDGLPSVCTVTRRQQWTPGSQTWEHLKQNSSGRDAQVTILGLARGKTAKILSRASLSFRTSPDPVGAPLFYREVELPFLEAARDPSRIRWRFGSITSGRRPPVVLEGLPVCGNCHSFSADGVILGMDVDYASNKGSYVITPVGQEMALAGRDIITWADYGGNEQNYGLLSQVSPDGRYVVSTVRDLSVFVAQPEMAFSQLFFPVKGILCVYDRQTGRFEALPGADDRRFVQSNPTWSPDGKHIVFARAEAPDLSNTKHQGLIWLTPAECVEFVADDKPFRFDLYRVPFNDGAGGTAVPLEGASHNGMSNFFARYSPDGRWIVFCRAESYMLLQPDSELYIIPAGGGPARRMRCNTPRMNSWHTWSPNGKWLVFATKAYSDYTQLCLTHVDDDGNSTPPVLLPHLTAPDRAANIPEFVNASPQAIARIRAQFLSERDRHTRPDKWRRR